MHYTLQHYYDISLFCTSGLYRVMSNLIDQRDEKYCE